MSSYAGGRRLRRSKRQLKNAFVARPCRFRRWHWYDWLFGILAAVLLVYAIISVIYASIFIGYYRNLRNQKQVGRDNHSVVHEVRNSYYYTNGLPLACSFLVAEVYLAILMILVLFWLRYLRNIGCCLILDGLIILAIIFFLSVGGVAAEKTFSSSAVRNYAYDYVTVELKGDYGMRFMARLEDYFHLHNCCGIHSYRDFDVWNQLQRWPTLNTSVPQACCKNHNHTADVSSRLNECQNANILPQPLKSTDVKKIHTNGCAESIQDAISAEKNFLKFIFQGFIIGILLFIFLLLFCVIMTAIYSKRVPDKWLGMDLKDPREQEDYAESDIIPGTPAKSMLSDSENTFYAP